MSTRAFSVPDRGLYPIRQFATTAVVLIVVASVASAGVRVWQLLAGEKWPWPEAFTVYAAIGVLHIPAGIAFVCWLFRARFNSYAISPGVFHTSSTSSLILGWIPPLSLFVPKGIVDDIWATSRPGGLWPGTDLLRVRRSALIWAWWLTWLLSGFMTVVTGEFAGGRPHPLETLALVACAVSSLAAGLLAVRVIMMITGLQEAARAGNRWRPGQAGAFEGGAHGPHLGLVTLFVRDHDEAVAFYVDTLGLELLENRSMDDGGRWVTVRPRGARETALLLVRAGTPEQEARVGDQSGLVFCTDDIVRDYEWMAAAGIAFDEAPRRELHGTTVAFRDPYGNRWELLQPNVSPAYG
ncbi:DUF4328 domain-containing protein [Streptosporangium sp. DT93]|uniref:DUF4328 domain-containing protein n=1 Tax=Streptosporangium sp. DT93 TaxID=3393428 RepID=UPI003CF55065